MVLEDGLSQREGEGGFMRGRRRLSKIEDVVAICIIACVCAQIRKDSLLFSPRSGALEKFESSSPCSGHLEKWNLSAAQRRFMVTPLSKDGHAPSVHTKKVSEVGFELWRPFT